MPGIAYCDECLASPISAVYHLAGTINLARRDDKRQIWNTNVIGTRNVIDFCKRYQVPHLYYVSTAYTLGRNPYEISKEAAEILVRASGIPKITIFKPSIVMGDGAHFRLEHFPLFALALIKVHRRADLIRRKIEGSLHLPPIEPGFRLCGNPDGYLNLVPVSDVVRMMARVTMPGTFWLTNASPPTMQELADWLGEAVLLKLTVVHDFTANPIEYAFQRITAAFQPYLEGDAFPSDVYVEKPITRETITEMVARVL
jgi:nucleoside-diphosphate-sugar epimerase